jgi:hypothetical protein
VTELLACSSPLPVTSRSAGTTSGTADWYATSCTTVAAPTTSAASSSPG